MMKQFLFCLLMILYHLSEAQKVGKNTSIQCCIEFRPNSAKSAYLIWQDNTIKLNAKDTCFKINAIKRSQQLSLFAEGYETRTLSINLDTLGANKVVRLMLLEKNILLKEVKVRPQSLIYYKEDTLIIRTDSVKIAPHASASSLLSRTPGVRVLSDGSVEIMGKKVSAITVNGKPLFGGNSRATLETLKGDMIQQLEILTSEQNPTLNIKLKPDKENGIYGSIDLGQGVDNKTYSLRLNKIHPKHFVNIYGIKNDINEAIVDIKGQDYWNKNSIFLGLKGAYSISTTAQEQMIALPDMRFYKLPNIDIQEGINQIKGLGFNASTSTKNASFYVYGITDSRIQQLKQSSEDETFLGSVLIKNTATSLQQNGQSQSWLSIMGQVEPNKKNLLKFKATYLESNKSFNINEQRFNNVSEPNLPDIEGVINRKEIKNEKSEAISSQLLWIKRYERLAKVTSVYVGHTTETIGLNNVYQNKFANISNTFAKSQQIVKNTQNNFLDIQVNHAIPLNRKFLFELKSSLLWAKDLIKQKGFDIDSTKANKAQANTTLGTDGFDNKQLTAFLQPSLFYKTGKNTLIVGLQLWHGHFERMDIYKSLYSFGQLATLPQIYLQHRNKQQSYFIRFSNLIKTASLNQVFSLSDSSNIQVIKQGNPSLRNTSINRMEIGVSGLNKLNINYSLSATLSINHHAFNTINQLGINGFSTITIGQIDQTKELSVFGLLIYLGKDNSRYFAIANYFSWQQSFFFLSNTLNRSDIYFNFFSLNTQFRLSEKQMVYVENRLNINWLKSKSLTNGNTQNEFSIKTDYSFGPTLYTDTKLNLINVFGNRKQFYPLVDFAVSKFLLPSNALKVGLVVKNVFNVNQSFQTSTTDNQISVLNTNFLPSVMMGTATLYLEKWKKKKVD